MKFFHSFKLDTKTEFTVTIGLIALYCLGFTARVYSPAHIGHHAIPIPTLIPVKSSIGATDTTERSRLNPNGLTSSAGSPLNFNHVGVITTYFWVGEKASGDNGYISNFASAWDSHWEDHYGGEDSPSPRNGFQPAGFTPKENPFYFALPYSDIDKKGDRKTTAASCPLADQHLVYSWCKNNWIAIRHNGKVAYAQWEDAGPFGEDDLNYVFGASAPANQRGSGAGLDVSPAVRDYLGLDDVDNTDWAFVNATAVPDGPWRSTITSTPGEMVE
jgi:hypothetical protein